MKKDIVDHVVLVLLCAQLYDASKNSEWEHLFDIEDIHVGVRKVGDTYIVVFRGSEDIHDWLDDVSAFPKWDSRLGFVHSGFINGMSAVMDALNPILGSKVAVTGHSLGGARARLFAALRIYAGLPIDQLTVFGSPKPGFDNVARLIQKSDAAHTSYRNRNDPVPLFPILPLWAHTEEWTTLHEHPDACDFDPIRDHFTDLYVRGLTKIVV